MKIKIKIIIICLLFLTNILFQSYTQKLCIQKTQEVNSEINNACQKVYSAVYKSYSLIKSNKKIEKENFFNALETKRQLYSTKQEQRNKLKEYELEQTKIKQEREAKENAKLIFIGDSRTVGMCNTVAGTTFWGTEYLDYTDSSGNIWIAHGGIAYAYLRDMGFPTAEKYLEPYDSVVVLMGINDDTPGSSYAELTNNFAEKWKDLNINVYYVSINPVVDSSNAARQYNRTNILLSNKNMGIKNNLSERVEYIDTYSEIINDFDTYDGIHYTDATSQKIYDFIINAIYNYI